MNTETEILNSHREKTFKKYRPRTEREKIAYKIGINILCYALLPFIFLSGIGLILVLSTFILSGFLIAGAGLCIFTSLAFSRKFAVYTVNVSINEYAKDQANRGKGSIQVKPFWDRHAETVSA